MRSFALFSLLASMAVIPACTCSRTETTTTQETPSSPSASALRVRNVQVRTPGRIQLNSATFRPVLRPTATAPVPAATGAP